MRNYRFDVEPANDHWQVFIEFSGDGAWQETQLKVPKGQLGRVAQGVVPERDELLQQWQQRLGGAEKA